MLRGYRIKNKNQTDELIVLLLRFGAHLHYATSIDQTQNFNKVFYI